MIGIGPLELTVLHTIVLGIVIYVIVKIYRLLSRLLRVTERLADAAERIADQNDSTKM